MTLPIKLIIGLGNPGKKYVNTYHNVGHLFADYLNSDLKLQIHPNLPTIKSNVYMNESGKFVAKKLKNYNIKPEKLLVIHDDSDIELGKYKFSFGRGSAGHKGVESIIAVLKTKGFWRLRIGIRSNTGQRELDADSRGQILRGPRKVSVSRRPKAEEFVLKKISPADKKILEKVLEEIFKT